MPVPGFGKSGFICHIWVAHSNCAQISHVCHKVEPAFDLARVVDAVEVRVTATQEAPRQVGKAQQVDAGPPRLHLADVRVERSPGFDGWTFEDRYHWVVRIDMP